jgi:transposase
MTKAETIRILHAERCSVSEIALAVGYKEKVIKVRLARPRPLAKDRISWAFNGWRGWPISDKVVSL